MGHLGTLNFGNNFQYGGMKGGICKEKTYEYAYGFPNKVWDSNRAIAVLVFSKVFLHLGLTFQHNNRQR